MWAATNKHLTTGQVILNAGDSNADALHQDKQLVHPAAAKLQAKKLGLEQQIQQAAQAGSHEQAAALQTKLEQFDMAAMFLVQSRTWSPSLGLGRRR